MSNIQKFIEKRLEVMREGPPAIWDREEIAILEALRDAPVSCTCRPDMNGRCRSCLWYEKNEAKFGELLK